ncbi:trimeric intracellular cation channel family protein [Dialister succinatiphilus]|uniref:trimeric intracellular cation channel family protein n=1 Tax=Dialister succinatiphilus TaxID=487173 RepID=UPI004026E240
MSVTWMIFEILGTIAFAFSGAIVGLYRRMDIFGITVLAVMTGVGGGMIRDVLCGIIPPSALTHPMSLLVSIGTALVVSLFYPFFRIPKKGRVIISFLYHLSDTIGLSAFTVTGVLTAFYAWPSYEYVLPTMLGLITAVGGGVIRDMMARRMPVVLYMDVYAIASVAGGLLMCILHGVLPLSLVSWTAFGAVLLLRVAAIHYGWQLYHPHRRLGKRNDDGKGAGK